MTYNKESIKIAGRDYVKETTRWLGHKHSVYVPITYPQDLLTMQGLFTLFLLTVLVLAAYGVFDGSKKNGS